MKSLLAAIVFAILCLPVSAVSAIPVKDVSVCPAGVNLPPVRFDTPGCERMSVAALDPQGRDIWVRTQLNLPKTTLGQGPLGLYVSAKAASEAYVNGVRIGANGTPGVSKAMEKPGRMDAVFYIPEGLLREGDNTIVLRLSSFHNLVRLSQPVHWIAIAPYAEPLDLLLRAYWPSLVTFGVLLAGAFFFASSAVSAVNRRDPLLLALLSLLAACQLFAEVYRGLVSYPYPAQDGRLIVIVGFATAFAVTLAALIAFRFAASRPVAVFAAIAALSLMPLIVMPGFDGKAAFSLLTAAIASALVCAYAALKGDRSGLVAGITLAVFAGSVLVFQERFLDTFFFYEVAAVILVLFTVRALMFERERREYEKMQMHARDLERALARTTEAKEPAVIRINGAGSVTIVKATDITLCKGADDYVELHLIDGRTILHSGALNDLETGLPASFLRVHRSYIVNAAFIEKLTRESSGIGVLTLSNGAEAPVSRRIMPKVRHALR
jgi:DNA-binding LytR/AlgR family response regulator